MQVRNNIIIKTDAYKLSQYSQYPPNTTEVESYLVSRGGVSDDIVHLSAQAIIEENLAGQVITRKKIDYAERVSAGNFLNDKIFNKAGWEYILHNHSGTLPLEIYSAPEGSVIPTGNVLMTVRNTDPNCAWLTSSVEGLLLHQWYGSTVATRSRNVKKIILRYLEETGTPETIDYKLHDFGYRGVSSDESAAYGGFAHLTNFKGTDTLLALEHAETFYGAPMDSIGHSIPASEHSTITSWGRDGELDAYKNLLEKYPTGLVACVSDSYDIFKACGELWGHELRDQILHRDGTLVVRPDSGDPVSTVIKVLGILMERFGYETNNKGFKVLPPQIRVIQGDGVNPNSIEAILREMKYNSFSADNTAFGMGGDLLQNVNRDTQKYAFKCSSIIVNGVQRDVYKDPVTDPGKSSLAGQLALVERPDGIKTIRKEKMIFPDKNILQLVFRNGEAFNHTTLEEIRKRAAL